jgi:hypothetical protein
LSAATKATDTAEDPTPVLFFSTFVVAFAHWPLAVCCHPLTT